MLGLPESTERATPLPKSDFFERFRIAGKEKARIDGEISRMAIAAFVSPATIPAWPQDGRGIYVVELALKKREISAATLALIAGKINQRIVFAMDFRGELQLAVPWKRLVRGEWMTADRQRIALRRNVDETWLGIIADIAGLQPGSEAELDAQFALRDRREKLAAEIERLDKAMRKERQFRRKHELYEQLRNLKKELETTGATT